MALSWEGGGNGKCWRERKTWNPEQWHYVGPDPILCTKQQS